MKEIKENNNSKKKIWIDADGSTSDMVILSLIIKQIAESDPTIEFNLIRNTRFTSFFSKNQNINKIGFPDKDTCIIKTDYWNNPTYSKDIPVFKLMANLFGKEIANFTGNLPYKLSKKEQHFYERIVPWKKNNVIIAPGTDSPRKMLHFQAWQHLVQSTSSEDLLFVQLGGNTYIPGTFFLKDIHNIEDIIYLIKKSSLVVSIDNEIMQLTYLLKKKAIFLLGPSSYPYERKRNQTVISGDKNHCKLQSECLKLKHPDSYASSCQLGLDHCMNKIQINKVINLLKK